MNESIRRLRSASVLCDVDGHRLDPDKAGVSLVTCGDCDRTPENEMFLRRAFDHSRLHEHKLNGAPFRIAENSPLNTRLGLRLPTDLDLLWDIAEGCFLKHTSSVVVCGHDPCGKAEGIPFEDKIDLLMEAKLRIKREVPRMMRAILREKQGLPPIPLEQMPSEELPQVKVAVFMHCDYRQDGEERMRTYFVSRMAWESHRAIWTKCGAPPFRVPASDISADRFDLYDVTPLFVDSDSGCTAE